MTYHAIPGTQAGLFRAILQGSRSWSPLSSTVTLCWLLPWRASRLGHLCTSALSPHTPPLSLSRAPVTAMVLTSTFLLFLQRHQRHLPRALSHTTALLRNLQQECPTTRHGSGFSAQSFMVWPHPALQTICSPLHCSNSPPRIYCPTSYSEIVPSRGAYGHSYPEPSSFPSSVIPLQHKSWRLLSTCVTPWPLTLWHFTLILTQHSQ